MPPIQTQITNAPSGHLLTNANVWSSDSNGIIYDIRSDPSGTLFDGARIEMVNIHTREVRLLYRSSAGASCGVATFHPIDNQVVFILGPEHPTADWSYSPCHRQGVLISTEYPGNINNLDARDLISPYTPGALRGGSHVHVFSADGRLVSFTYEDAILSAFTHETTVQQINLRGIGVTTTGTAVAVPIGPRNHPGTGFTTLVTSLRADPTPGSDEINRACEEAWIGTNGYTQKDDSRQQRALAFQGQVMTADHQLISEVFIVDLPNDLTIPGKGPLQGTDTHRPYPPSGVNQRRLTFTANRKHPGLQGPRHWLRSAPDGSEIACLMKDDAGIVQLFGVCPNGGPLRQITHNDWPISSAFTWSPDGRSLTAVIDHSVFLIHAASGDCRRLTLRSAPADSPRPEACVFSPNGRHIAYVRNLIGSDGQRWNQIFTVACD